jgi:hypothetical protein
VRSVDMGDGALAGVMRSSAAGPQNNATRKRSGPVAIRPSPVSSSDRLGLHLAAVNFYRLSEVPLRTWMETTGCMHFFGPSSAET